MSISTEVKKSVEIRCKISSTNFEKDVIFWYWQKPNQALSYLIHVSSTKFPAQSHKGGKYNKVEARKNSQILTSILTINFIEKEDAAIYYCAGWTHSVRTVKAIHTRSPPWICAHPHPSREWRPQSASWLSSWPQPQLVCSISWGFQEAILDYICTLASSWSKELCFQALFDTISQWTGLFWGLGVHTICHCTSSYNWETFSNWSRFQAEKELLEPLSSCILKITPWQCNHYWSVLHLRKLCLEN